MRILNKKVWPYRVDFTYKVDVDLQTLIDYEKWLREAISPDNFRVVSETKNTTIYFKNESDMIWFQLRC